MQRDLFDLTARVRRGRTALRARRSVGRGQPWRVGGPTPSELAWKRGRTRATRDPGWTGAAVGRAAAQRGDRPAHDDRPRAKVLSRGAGVFTDRWRTFGASLPSDV